MKIRLSLCLVAVVLVAMPALADVSVYVGYADNLRASPFFPNPWQGSGSVGLFAGGGTFDAGAVRIQNTGLSSIVINDLTVVIHPANGAETFQIWGGFLPFTLNPGQDAIFTQTSSFNLDTSDFPIVGQDISNNCSVGALASSLLCTSNANLVGVTLDGIYTPLFDTAHVLDTGGFDANCCLPFGNESLQWRLIGTTGVENPGGVPEPSTLVLLGTGLLGVGNKAWKRFIG